MKKPIHEENKNNLETENINASTDNFVKMYNNACFALKEKRYQDAYAIFRSISLSPYGQNGLGVCYAYGFYIEKDMDKAAYWFQKAARQDFGVAQFNLANCYYWGSGIIQNSLLADYWYLKSIEHEVRLAKEMKTYTNTGFPKETEAKQNIERWNKIASVFILQP